MGISCENEAQEAEVVANPNLSVQQAETSPLPSKADNVAELKALLSQARGTKQMLEDFLAAIHGSQVSGHVVYRLAIGIQFIEHLIKQNKNDIERLQTELKNG